MTEENGYYVTNKELLIEMKKMRETCKYDIEGHYIEGSCDISEELGRMFILIAENLSKKANFSGYTWKDDMIAEAVFTCVKYCKNFDPEKSNNPFAYVTQICRNVFINYIRKQNRHGDIKDTCYNRVDIVEGDSYFCDKAIDYTLLIDND